MQTREAAPVKRLTARAAFLPQRDALSLGKQKKSNKSSPTEDLKTKPCEMLPVIGIETTNTFLVRILARNNPHCNAIRQEYLDGKFQKFICPWRFMPSFVKFAFIPADFLCGCTGTRPGQQNTQHILLSGSFHTDQRNTSGLEIVVGFVGAEAQTQGLAAVPTHASRAAAGSHAAPGNAAGFIPVAKPHAAGVADAGSGPDAWPERAGRTHAAAGGS